MTCEYGCEQESKFILNNGKRCCSKSYQGCPKQRTLNSEKIKTAHAKGLMRTFVEEDRKKSLESRLENIKSLPFEFWGKKLKVDQILLDQGGRCDICNISDWMGNPIKLQLDHISGNRSDESRSNLRLICPNCHSQTDTFCGKNVNSGHIKVSDEMLLTALQSTCSIAQALKTVGLTPKGGNYARARKLLERSK